jgi:hypothetical protein
MPDFSGRRTDEPLEERVGRLEDLEAIKNLKHQYARYCDSGYDANGFASLFVEDGIWDSNAFGVYRGRDEIFDFIAGLREEILWALHYMVNPIIDIADDGLSARGTWILLEPATMGGLDGSSERDAVVITANYEDEFVKVDGEWRFKKVKAHFHQVSNLDQGWVKQPFRGE